MLWMQLIQFLQSVVEFNAEAEKDLLPDCSRDQDEQTKILSFYIWIYLPRFTCDNITAFSLNVSESSNFDYVKKIL